MKSFEAWKNGWLTEAVGELSKSITVVGPTESDFSLELIGEDLSEEEDDGDRAAAILGGGGGAAGGCG